jgi:thiol-disulfide isomerase/thioredoxin
MRRLIINGETALQFHNDNMNKMNPVVFAKYYSPSCPACIAMSDEWDNMATDIDQKYETDLVVADIEPSGMNVLEKTSTHSEVDYVPSLVILSNGNKIKQYQGSREKKQMIQFLLDEGYMRTKQHSKRTKQHSKKTKQHSKKT